MPKKSELVWKFEYDMEKRNYFHRLALVFDQFFNVLLWNGSQDETISSHMGRRIAAGKANRVEKWLCGVISMVVKSHCEKALGE